MRGVGFVSNDRVAALFQADAILDGTQHVGESLDGDNNNWLRVLQAAARAFFRSS